MIYFLIYLITIADNLIDMLLFGGVIFAFAGLVIGMVYYSSGGQLTPGIGSKPDEGEKKKPKAKLHSKLLIAATIMIAISALVPTTKQFVMIIGGGLAYEALTSETAKEITNQIISGTFTQTANDLATEVLK